MNRLHHMYRRDHFFKTEWLSLVVLLAMWIVAVVALNQAPRYQGFVATGFDALGRISSIGTVFGNILLLPIVSLVIYAILLAIPHIAVYKRNVTEFYKRHFGFKLVILKFIFVIYIAQLLPVLGSHLNQLYFIVPAISLMLMYIGHLLRHLHRNYFFGIRTPWTLARDDIWNKTHKFGSAVFEICGVLLLFGLVWQEYFLYILLVTVLGGALICVVYSYLLFSRDHI